MSLVCIYVKSMHEVPRLMPIIRKIFTNGSFKTFVSVPLLALDSNRVARALRVFKIGIELVDRSLFLWKPVFSLKTNTELLKKISNKKLPNCPCL